LAKYWRQVEHPVDSVERRATTRNSVLGPLAEAHGAAGEAGTAFRDALRLHLMASPPEQQAQLAQSL
jgi:hypothetical protein